MLRLLRMVSPLIANVIKGIGDGKYGKGPRDIYWSLAGSKTLIAMGVVALYGILGIAVNLFGQCAPECATVEAVAQLAAIRDYFPGLIAFLVSIGLYDAAIRIEPPKNPKG